MLRMTVLVTGTMVAASVSQAGPSDNLDARIAAHFAPGCISKGCDPACGNVNADPTLGQTPVACGDFTVDAPVDIGGFVYVVVGRGGREIGIQGASFGIDYPPPSPPAPDATAGIHVQWTLCADGLEFPSTNPVWPAPGSGTRLTWASCQTRVIQPDGVHAVAGAFYVFAYSADVFALTSNNPLVSGPELAVSDCESAVTEFLAITPPAQVPELTGRIGFGGAAGFTPCQTVATVDATWGQMKTRFPADDD